MMHFELFSVYPIFIGCASLSFILLLAQNEVMKIALIEDDARTRGRIALLLSRSLPSATIEQFDQLGSALRYAKTHAQDYWLIDLGLPDGSGIELIKAVRNQYPDTNILVISVFGDVDNILGSIQAGANGYLLKDAVDKDLHGAIEAIESGGTPLSPMIASRLLERMLPVPVAHMNASVAAMPDKLLTVREVELLNLLSRGYTYNEAAGLMKIGITTVQTHIRHIYSKLAVGSRSEAVFEAKAMGLIDA
jgi:DNA-binding NarL/FixJ family response regulator